jgi:DNA replication protein DnaC
LAGEASLKAVLTNTMLSNSTPVTAHVGVCPECGQALPTHHMSVYGVERVFVGVCPCRLAQEQAEAVARAHQEKVLRVERFFALSRLGKLFAECTFDNWQGAAGAESALKHAQAYVARWPVTDGLLFFGPPGNGKSHLAAAVVHALIKQHGVAAVFQNVPDLLAQVRATYDGQGKEWQVVEALLEADLLVLDDIGAEKPTRWGEETLYRLVDARYRHKKPLVVTSNLAPADLEAWLGLRIMDRLQEMCLFVCNSAPSYRAKRAMERVRGLAQ